MAILSLIPPGGFSNQVGHYVAALDIALDEIKSAAADATDPRPILAAIGELERAWIHEAVGGVPSPTSPDEGAEVDDWLAWLDAIRTVSVMVLRPLLDRDLERVVRSEGAEGRTLKRLLAELLFQHGSLHGRLVPAQPADA
jgi:hypothetical protein